MSDQFINVYVDLLNASFVDAVNKNLILQAQQKVAEMELTALKEINEKTISAAHELDSLRNQLSITQNDLTVSRNSSQHLETFKSELLKAREEIKEKNIKNSILNDELEAVKVIVSNLSFDIEGLKQENSNLIKENKKLKKDLSKFEEEVSEETVSDKKRKKKMLEQQPAENLEINNISDYKDAGMF